MRAGQYRHRVSIEQPPSVDDVDEAGQPVSDWTTYLGPVYGYLRPASSREIVAAGAVQNAVTHILTIRYRSDKTITSKMRVKFGTRILNIKGVRNVEERNEDLELDLEEGLKS